MIRLEHLTKSFSPPLAINDLSLHVHRGEILGFVGPDGAGKTTLIRLMLGLLQPSAGTIRLFDTADIESVKARIGYVAQKFSLYRDLTVLENISLLGALYGINQQTIHTRAQEILSFTGLWEFRNRLSERLSGGMKQKLALAAGLIHRPDLIFLDEPTTGVDPVARREFWQLLYHLNRQGMTIVIATPYMDEAELCHTIAFISRGKILRHAAPDELVAAYPYELLALDTNTQRLPRNLSHSSIIDLNSFGTQYHLATTSQLETENFLTAYLPKHGISTYTVTKINPSLEDVFVHLAGKAGDQE